jgi:adhesin transport system membrane fusion protein
MTKPLLAEGAASEVEVLRLEQRHNELQTRRANFISTAQLERNKARDEMLREEQNARTLKDRFERTDVRSPIDGIVKQIHIQTIGGVIKPGQDLAEIVPVGDTLLVEARIKPDDIGFIRVGQKAMVKITAYDFAIYGGLEGTVEHISADASTEKTDEGEFSYFEVWVRTKKNYLEGKKRKLFIIPGMQASVDIITGEKSVLDYILKPILRAKQSALRER